MLIINHFIFYLGVPRRSQWFFASGFSNAGMGYCSGGGSGHQMQVLAALFAGF